jgi:hypothetical protein
MSYHRNIESEFKRNGTRVTKTPAGDNRNANAGIASGGEGFAITLCNVAARV